MTNKGAGMLREWIGRRGLNQRESADVLRVHESLISNLLKGNRTPSLHLAVRIEAVTGIPPTSWTLSVRDKTKKAAPSLAESTPVLQGENS